MKRLKKSLTFSIGLLCFIIGANNAYAGYYADQLSQCLVKNTNEEDRKNLAKWVFSVIAQHPDIKEFISITPEQQKVIEKTAIDLFEQLVTQDCKNEFISVIKYETKQGILISFNALGEVSMMTLCQTLPSKKRLQTSANNLIVMEPLRSSLSKLKLNKRTH